jgi:hypothetical protein
MAGMRNSSKTCSRISAPARRMSARRASTPGSLARASLVGALTRAFTTASRSSRRSSKLFQVWGGASPRRATSMEQMAPMLPDEPTATSNPKRRTSRANEEIVARA